jgi:hypothetical protein
LFLLSHSSKKRYCKLSFDRAIIMKIIKKGPKMLKIWSMFGDGPMFDDGHVYLNSCNQNHFVTNMRHQHSQLSWLYSKREIIVKFGCLIFSQYLKCVWILINQNHPLLYVGLLKTKSIVFDNKFE